MEINILSLDITKVDPELGKRVYEHLNQLGVETPRRLNGITDEEKITRIQASFTEIMDTLGLNLEDDSLKETPKRLAKMYVQEIYWGLSPKHFPKMTAIENKMGYDEMVLEKNIVVQSTCEHHFAAIDGYAHVAYIPRHKVLGLSKLNRVVEYFSRRPQVQERLTEQIFHTLGFILETPDIAVMVNAKHFCVKSRGIEDINSETMTSKLGGCFKENQASRQEFFSLVRPYLSR